MPFPNTFCSKAIGGLMARFTRLDDCCGPPLVPGLCDTATSKFISLVMDPDIEEATEYTQKLADDTLCINESGCPQLKGFDLTLQLCQYDPELLEMILGADLYADFAGNPIGFFLREDFGSCPAFGLEVWARGPREQCTTAPNPNAFMYFLFPCVSTAGLTGGFNFNNEAQTIEITAKAKSSALWGTGPYDVVPIDLAGTPGPLLTPIGSNQPVLVTPTSVAPPNAACGCYPLDFAPPAAA